MNFTTPFAVPTEPAQAYTEHLEQLHLRHAQDAVNTANVRLAHLVPGPGTDIAFAQISIEMRRLRAIPEYDMPDSVRRLYPGTRPVRYRLDERYIIEEAQATAKRHLALLTERVNGQLGQGEEIADCRFWISGGLLEGNVRTSTGGRIEARQKTNYRYGENSSNGYLTVYAQFPVTRHGTPLPGASITAAIKAAEKADRAAAKEAAHAERRAAKREKFLKALPREAKKLRKLAQERTEYLATLTDESHRKHVEALIAGNLKTADEVEAFDLDSIVEVCKGHPGPVLDVFTSASALAYWLNDRNKG